MLEDDGHWLKLMRTATLPTDGNICLRISGEDIICMVTKDVNKEVELKVTCRIADPCHEQKPNQSQNEPLKSPEAPNVKEVGLAEEETVPDDCTSPKAMLDCVPNCVSSYSDTAFRSSSSLNSREVSEERSFKSENVESDIDMEEYKEEVSSSTARESPSSDQASEPRFKSEDEMSHVASQNSESETRKAKTNDVSVLSTSPEFEYASVESYHYEKHNRTHHSPNSTRTTSSLTNPQSFCDACKIQFLSVNTYQVHKKFYCKSRHESEDAMTPMPILDAAPGELSAAFKPAADTVILRGGMNGGVVPSIIQPQAIFAAISTKPLILLPCTLIPGQGLVPQNCVMPTGAPRVILQSCSSSQSTGEEANSKPGETSGPPRKTSYPIMNTGDKHNDSTLLSSSKIAALKRKISEGEVLNLKKTCTANESYTSVPDQCTDESKDTDIDQDSPLDLSLKLSDILVRKSPLRRRSSVISSGHPPSPVLRVCGSGSPPATSVISSVHSAPSPTNSYSNESTCYAPQVPVVVHKVPPVVSDRISPLPPVLQSAATDKQIPAPGMLPPKLMKQGNNICEECKIVFIKYDNLITHKKHYCAYRRRQLSAMAAAMNQEHSSDDNNSNHSGVNEGATGFQTEDSKSGIMRKLEYGIEHYRQVLPKPSQYLCDACGVRFSTSDTLVAHQTYYCMKKPDSAMAKACNKKGDDGSSSSIESPFSGPEEWKCNYCDATCSSYDTIRRHLLTHEPRGYRCLLCGYKGNTLRGMRNHACEHLNEDTTSIEEFMSSTIIGETGIMPIIPRPLDCSDEDSDPQREPMNYEKRERTSSNNSDTSKDRSSKHENIVTDHSESEEVSVSQKNVENFKKDKCSKGTDLVKTESGDSSSDVSGNHEPVNPLSFCDVVIKSENDHNASGEDSDRNEAFTQQERCYDSDEKPTTCQPRSVIRVAERTESTPQSSKRKSKSQTKTSSDLNYCKSCGVSFQHLSNLLTHKQYYCVSRSRQNCLPEAAKVQ